MRRLTKKHNGQTVTIVRDPVICDGGVTEYGDPITGIYHHIERGRYFEFEVDGLSGVCLFARDEWSIVNVT